MIVSMKKKLMLARTSYLVQDGRREPFVAAAKVQRSTFNVHPPLPGAKPLDHSFTTLLFSLHHMSSLVIVGLLASVPYR
jgi:hypothetical protein